MEIDYSFKQVNIVFQTLQTKIIYLDKRLFTIYNNFKQMFKGVHLWIK